MPDVELASRRSKPLNMLSFSCHNRTQRATLIKPFAIGGMTDGNYMMPYERLFIFNRCDGRADYSGTEFQEPNIPDHAYSDSG